MISTFQREIFHKFIGQTLKIDHAFDPDLLCLFALYHLYHDHRSFYLIYRPEVLTIHSTII